MVIHYPVKVIALLHSLNKKGKPKTSWEIAINKRNELIKLQDTDFPVTVRTNPDGLEFVLVDGNNVENKCEVSIHRLNDNYKKIWINSARKRLKKDEEQTRKFHSLLAMCGADVGKLRKSKYITLEFISKGQANIFV